MCISCPRETLDPWGVLPYKRLIGMCRWMGSHFHDWIDCNGVAFSIDLLEWGRTSSGVGALKGQRHIPSKHKPKNPPRP